MLCECSVKFQLSGENYQIKTVNVVIVSKDVSNGMLRRIENVYEVLASDYQDLHATSSCSKASANK